MKRLLFCVALAFGGASPALAGCNPPAGMLIQQWYGVCGEALQEAYAQGMGNGMPFENFVGAMYQVYAQPVMQQPQPTVQPAPMQMCTPGATACFSGWLRTCQTMATGSTMWMTGAQRCD